MNLIKNRINISLFFFAICLSVHVNAQTSNWTLKQCVDTALKNNLTIQQSSNTIEINSISLKQNKTNLLPTLNGSATESFGSGRSLNPSNYQFTTENVWSNNFSLNSSVTLFNGFQNSNSIKQGQLNYESSKYDMENTKNDVTMAIVNTYLQVLHAKELIKNSEKQVETTTAQLERVKELVNIGLKPESDLLELKSQLATDNVTLVKAQGQFKSVKINLQQQMNISFSPSFDIEYVVIPEIQPLITENANDIYSLALSYQPIIKSYQLKSQSEIYGIKIAKGGSFPTLSLKGSFGTSYSSASKYNDITYQNSIPVYTSSDYPFWNQLSDFRNNSLSLSLSIPIYNGFQVHNNIQKQKINFENALLSEQNVKNNLRKNIEQAYVDAENASANLNAIKQQLDASLASYENASTKYENGIINVSDLLVIKNKYIIAQSQYLQAKYELLFRMKILDYYKGVPIDL